MAPTWGSASQWASGMSTVIGGVADAAGSSAAGVFGAASTAAAGFLQHTASMPSHQIMAASILACAVPTMVVLYVAFLRRSSRGPTPGFNRLRSKKAGSGKASKAWTLQVQDSNSKGPAGGATAGGVTWLGETELAVLEAFGDTFLPGFDVSTTEAADETVEQVVAVVESRVFRGRASSAEGPTPHLPPATEAYTRALARQCLEMHARPASDIGVAGLLAEAFEANISHEQRSGLCVLFRILSTRLGAFLLTGRAVPLPSQDLSARHSLLKSWSVSRIGKFREAFQGMKRLTCSLYFSAHPGVPSDMSPLSAQTPAVVAAAATIKMNPNWSDIRYEPQHHRIARDGPPQIAMAKLGLWSGAKVKAVQVARAAAAASSPSRLGPSPPSPCSASASTVPGAPKFFSRPTGNAAGTSHTGNGAFGGGTRGGDDKSAAATPTDALPSELVVDVVVVGSGAGGGCVAGTLAATGLKVVVLEKGGLYDATDFGRFSEMEAYQKLYEGQGVLASDDGAVVILAGACVGGGTTVNWTASFRTPRHVRLEWARKLGLTSFELGGPFEKALDAVCERLGVNTDHSHRAPGCPVPHPSLIVNQHQSNLWNGAVASGRVPKVVPRNAKGCVDCGSCLHGCASGSKRSTHATWLQDGLNSGNLTLIPNAKVDRVLWDEGRATGVTATVTPRDGGKATPLKVLARAVVVSGGAIHTPAILLRSGLTHPLIGRHLHLHPVLSVGGVFPEDYEARTADTHKEKSTPSASSIPANVTVKQGKKYSDSKSKAEAGLGLPSFGPRVPSFGRGVMMGTYVQDLMGLDEGYGCVIEAAPLHPGLAGLVMPWNDGLSHRLAVAMSKECSAFICIGRDRSSADNRVVLGPRGDPVIKYKLGREDSEVILQGRSEMLRLMRKAGASILVPAHEGAPWFCPEGGKESEQQFEEYVDAIEALGTTANEAGLFSAHQMGTCRLSTTPAGGPLRETGEAWECNGLFVADASVLPTAIGINPMITVEAVAYMIAEQVATRLGKEASVSSGRSDVSPLRRRLSNFGKAVVAAISRDASATENEMMPAPMEPFNAAREGSYDAFRGAGGSYDAFRGAGGSYDAFRGAGGSPRSPTTRRKTAGDDYGVSLESLAW